MPLYIGDYLRDTMHLTTEQHGAYLLLIFAYWTTGPLLDDDEWLSSITKLCRPDWEQVRPTMEGFFHVEDGFWCHKRIDEELRKASSIANARSLAGKAGMAKRWCDKADNTVINKPVSNAVTKPQQTDIPSPSPSPSQGVQSNGPLILEKSERITLEKSHGRALNRIEELRRTGPYEKTDPRYIELQELKAYEVGLRAKLNVKI
jgi:uncharacterized protein YdaU (DUF1376 family)